MFFMLYLISKSEQLKGGIEESTKNGTKIIINVN